MSTYTKTNFVNVDNERPNTFFEDRVGDLVTHAPAFGTVTNAGVAPASNLLNKQEDAVSAIHDQIDAMGTAEVHPDLQNKTLQEQIDFINSKIYKFQYTIPYGGQQKVLFPRTVNDNAIIRISFSGNAAVSILNINDVKLDEGGYHGYKTDESGNHLAITGVFDGTNGDLVGPIQVIASHPDTGTFYSLAETTIHKSQYTGFVYTSFSNHSKTGSFSETIRGFTAMEPVFAEGINNMLVNVHPLQSGNPSRPQYLDVEVTYFD